MPKSVWWNIHGFGLRIDCKLKLNIKGMFTFNLISLANNWNLSKLQASLFSTPLWYATRPVKSDIVIWHSLIRCPNQNWTRHILKVRAMIQSVKGGSFHERDQVEFKLTGGLERGKIYQNSDAMKWNRRSRFVHYTAEDRRVILVLWPTVKWRF